MIGCFGIVFLTKDSGDECEYNPDKVKELLSTAGAWVFYFLYVGTISFTIWLDRWFRRKLLEFNKDLNMWI